MNQKRLWASAAIIAIVILAGFVISVPRVRDIPETLVPRTSSVGAPEITLRDTFKKGVHTIAGSLMANDACSTVSSSAELQGSASSTQNILLAILLESSSGVCLELPTRMTFQTTIEAPARLPIIATVNGESATTTSP